MLSMGIDNWKEYIYKDIHNVSVAFEIIPTGGLGTGGWKKSYVHIIWDLNMNFTRNSRWVKDGHRTTDTKESNYAEVVSRDSVRISLTYTALNDVDVTAANTQNAYL